MDIHSRDRAAALFKALGSTTRLQLLEVVATESLTVSELAERVGITQPLASQHLRTLKGVGAVRPHRQGRTVRYRLADHNIHQIVEAGLDRDDTPRGRRPSVPPVTGTDHR